MEDYTGLAAVAWELFSGEEPGRDYAFFRQIVARHGGPALDIGCGTGRLLLPLLREGEEVEGVDPSADMLALCRERGARLGLAPALHRQTLQTLDLPRRYRTILVPCGTIQLVIDHDDVWEALRRMNAHLETGGILALTVFNRWLELETEIEGAWKHRATKPLPDGSLLTKDGLVEACDRVEQVLRGKVRYRRFRDERLIEEQVCDAPERWYFQHEMTLMLEKVGFRVRSVTGNYTEAPFRDGHDVMTFQAEKEGTPNHPESFLRRDSG
jgi:SAM-dependent methyltransferase